MTKAPPLPSSPPPAAPSIVEDYAAELQRLCTLASPIREHHRSMAMAAFHRGDMLLESLHSRLMSDLEEICGHLRANLAAALVMKDGGGK